MSATTSPTFYEIPTVAQPRTITVSLGAVEYEITFRWANAAGGGWIIDIADNAGNLIVAGIPLVTGADLLAQYEYLGIGAIMLVGTDGDPTALPTFANLGTGSHLYFALTP